MLLFSYLIQVTLPYGKLMERLLVFRKMLEEGGEESIPFYRKMLPQAEAMLKTIRYEYLILKISTNYVA